jgi:type I restriction-modification system DNA methylase subunit
MGRGETGRGEKMEVTDDEKIFVARIKEYLAKKQDVDNIFGMFDFIKNNIYILEKYNTKFKNFIKTLIDKYNELSIDLSLKYPERGEEFSGKFQPLVNKLKQLVQ